MAKSSGLVMKFVIILFTALISSLSTVDASGDLQLGWIPTISTCQGSIAECLAGDELDMDTEINRRILATIQPISYRALKNNNVPCPQPGAPYYNCQPGAQVRPYDRGCSTITLCRH